MREVIPLEILKKWKVYYRSLYANTFNNLGKMNKFLV